MFNPTNRRDDGSPILRLEARTQVVKPTVNLQDSPKRRVGLIVKQTKFLLQQVETLGIYADAPSRASTALAGAGAGVRVESQWNDSSPS